MLQPIATIARATLLEALSNRMAWVLAAIALAAAGLAGFLGELALTESRQVQTALLAALLRLAAVFLVAVFVITSMLREANDKGVEMLLALPIPRAAYVLGKLAGFALLALLPAALFGALALTVAPAPSSAAWALSLLCELWIVASFSLLCALSLRNVLPALAATAGFYVLARSAGSLQALASSAGVDALAALLPHLDSFTRTEWLLYHTANAHQIAAILLQTAIYVALLGAAAMVDFYRRNF